MLVQQYRGSHTGSADFRLFSIVFLYFQMFGWNLDSLLYNVLGFQPNLMAIRTYFTMWLIYTNLYNLTLCFVKIRKNSYESATL